MEQSVHGYDTTRKAAIHRLAPEHEMISDPYSLSMV